MIELETYLLLMQTAQEIKNKADAIRLYYTLRQKPKRELTAFDRIHIDNMEQYAAWNKLDL